MSLWLLVLEYEMRQALKDGDDIMGTFLHLYTNVWFLIILNELIMLINCLQF